MTDSAATAVGIGSGRLLAGRYLLGPQVGRGGMADVYAAHDEVLDRAVAVKLFRFDTVTGQDRARVESEIRTVAGLRHRGVVTVFDAGLPDQPGAEAAFVVMELINGPSLADRLHSGPLPDAHAATLGADLAATLAYLHERGIVHRDIKPANILLDHGGDEPAPFAAKLTDFGVARLVDTPRLTDVGVTIGTANYLSPEQVTGAAAGPPADVYALGLVLLEACTGQRAYPGTGVTAALHRLRQQPTIPARLGQPWTRLLVAMTALDPDARPRADEVAAELAAYAATVDAEPSPIAQSAAPIGTPTARTIVTPQVAPADTRVYLAGALSGRHLPRIPMRWAVLAAAGVTAFLLALIIVLAENGQPASSKTPAPPHYPTVSGVLGTHLQQLESAVG